MLTLVAVLGQNFPTLAASWASLKRIEKFLLLEERQERRIGSAEKLQNISESLGDIELETRTSPAIVMEHAEFSWAPDADSFLKDLTLRCDEPKLYMCVGPVASVSTIYYYSTLVQPRPHLAVDRRASLYYYCLSSGKQHARPGGTSSLQHASLMLHRML